MSVLSVIGYSGSMVGVERGRELEAGLAAMEAALRQRPDNAMFMALRALPLVGLGRAAITAVQLTGELPYPYSIPVRSAEYRALSISGLLRPNVAPSLSCSSINVTTPDGTRRASGRKSFWRRGYPARRRMSWKKRAGSFAASTNQPSDW